MRIAAMETEGRKPETAKFPLSVRLYVLLIQLLGLVAVGFGIREAFLAGNPQWGYLLILTAAASLLSTQISRRGTPSGSVTISLGDFFVFVAMVLLGPAAAALMGAVEGLVSSWRVKIKRFYKILFNACQLALTSFLVGYLVGYLPLELRVEEGVSVKMLALLLGCGLLYFLLNSLLVAVAMWLVSRQSIREIGGKGFLWALPTVAVNASLVVILLSLLAPIQLGLLLALLPLVAVAYLLTGIRDSEQTAGLFSGSFLPRSFTQKAKGYLLGVILLALPVYLYCLHQSLSLEDGNWLYLAALAVGASCFPIRLFSITDKLWLTLSDVFVFVALFQFGVEVAVVVASIEALAFNFRQRPQQVYRWVFNLAQIILVAFLVGTFFRLLQAGLSRPGHLEVGTVVLLLVAPWVCGFLYYALSSGLTGMVIALASRQSFLQVWCQNLVWYQASVIGAVCAALTYVLVTSFVP